MKPTSSFDVEVLLGREFTKHLLIDQQGNVVILKLKHRIPVARFVQLVRKVRDMGGSYRRGLRQFEIPVVEKEAIENE